MGLSRALLAKRQQQKDNNNKQTHEQTNKNKKKVSRLEEMQSGWYLDEIMIAFYRLNILNFVCVRECVRARFDFFLICNQVYARVSMLRHAPG